MDRYGILKPSRLPIVVAALVIPTVIAAVVGGPGFGGAMAAIVLIGILVFASRSGPEEPIEVAPAPADATRRVLLVLSEPVRNPAAARRIFEMAAGSSGQSVEFLALAPTQPHFLDRWASDVRVAQAEALEKLAVTVETLELGPLEPRTAVGDSDIVLAVEDTLSDFAADEVILATGTAETDAHGMDAAAHLRARLEVPFDHVVDTGPRWS